MPLVHTDWSWPIGALAGLAYCYMAAAWGGYPSCSTWSACTRGAAHHGNYTPKLHRAYTLFLIGTAVALQVPVIGWQPLQSLEQLGPLAIFFVLQLLAVADIGRALLSLGPEAHQRLQMMMLGMGAAAVAMLLSAAMEAGYLGPVSARVRGLFIATKTGNPLVDSVAEHRPHRHGRTGATTW